MFSARSPTMPLLWFSEKHFIMFTLNLKFVEVTTNRTENKINSKVIKLFSIHFFSFFALGYDHGRHCFICCFFKRETPLTKARFLVLDVRICKLRSPCMEAHQSTLFFQIP